MNYQMRIKDPMFQKFGRQILQEISHVLNGVDELEAARLVEALIAADKIVTCGAGRMGMMARAFAMRLGHLNLKAYHINDCNVPRIGDRDVLLACSGSGETKTILSLVEVAKSNGAGVALVTSRSESSMSRLSDVKVLLPAPSKVDSANSIHSIQPMTSLTEQSSLLFFDALVLMLMQNLDQTHDLLKTRHSILE